MAYKVWWDEETSFYNAGAAVVRVRTAPPTLWRNKLFAFITTCIWRSETTITIAIVYRYVHIGYIRPTIWSGGFGFRGLSLDLSENMYLILELSERRTPTLVLVDSRSRRYIRWRIYKLADTIHTRKTQSYLKPGETLIRSILSYMHVCMLVNRQVAKSLFHQHPISKLNLSNNYDTCAYSEAGIPLPITNAEPRKSSQQAFC